MKTHLATIIIFSAFILCKTSAQTSAIVPPSKSNNMKEFSLLVRVPVSYTTEQAKTVGPKWDKLLEQWKKDNVYIISFPFPAEGYIISGPDKTTTKGSVVSDQLRVVSNLFIRAADNETAIKLAKDCPILEFGGSVEVREIPQKSATIK